MTDTNDRPRIWSFSQEVFITLAIIMLSGGVAWGTVVAGQRAMAKDLSAIRALLEDKYYTKDQIETMKTQAYADMDKIKAVADNALQMAREAKDNQRRSK